MKWIAISYFPSTAWTLARGFSALGMLIIPPEVIHTSEGVNGGRHLLIDIFSPPRKYFIAKNWVLNASEYVAP